MKKPGARDPEQQIKRAGKSLHDDVAPLLAAAGLKLQLLRMDFPETTEQVSEVLTALDEAMEHIRRLSQQLSPSPFTPPSAT